MDIVIGFVVGVFVGAVVCMLVFLFLIGSWYLGDLREDRSDEDSEKPYYFMELAKGSSFRLMKNRFVLLKIKRENYARNNEIYK
jgi:hypothetical protein